MLFRNGKVKDAGAAVAILSVFALVASCALADTENIEYLYFISLYFTGFTFALCTAFTAKRFLWKMASALALAFLPFCLMVEFYGDPLDWNWKIRCSCCLLMCIGCMATFIIEGIKEGK